jgi:hypothetical protein
MTSKFEQLIEYVINDEEHKARELFHDIVVEKSREIYENLMQDEMDDLEEGKHEEELEEDQEELEEGKYEEELEEGLDDIEEMGGDASQDFMKDVETEEQGMFEEDDATDGDLENRVVDLEDKLDELMADFEAMMSDDGDADMGVAGGDSLEMDDTEQFDKMTKQGGEEQGEEEFELAEGLDLKAAPKPTTSEEGGINKKGVVAANSGSRGAVARPVHTTGGEEKGRAAPTAKDVGVTPTQDAGGKAFKTAAPKPVTTQSAGVNARTPFPKG